MGIPTRLQTRGPMLWFIFYNNWSSESKLIFYTQWSYVQNKGSDLFWDFNPTQFWNMRPVKMISYCCGLISNRYFPYYFSKAHYHKKNKKYHTVRTVLNSNRKIVWSRCIQNSYKLNSSKQSEHSFVVNFKTFSTVKSCCIFNGCRVILVMHFFYNSGKYRG